MAYDATTYTDGVTNDVTAAKMNKAEAGIATAQAAVDVIKEAPLNIAHYGAVLDGSTPNDAALAASIAALPATGSGAEIFFPHGTAIFANPFPSLDGKRGITLMGEGAPGNGFGQGSEIIYTGTAASFISAKQAQGLLIERLGIRYNNAGFTGCLIDLRNTSGSGASDTRDVTFRRCYLGAAPTTLNNAAALVRGANAHGLLFDGVAFGDAQRAIIGRDTAADYCIGVTFTGQCIFERFALAPLHNAGESWTVECSRVEQLLSGAAGLYTHDSGVLAKAMAFRDLWLGDVSASGGYWVKWAGSGLVLDGGRWGHEISGGGAVLVDANNCHGIEVRGGHYIGGAQVINFGATTGHLGVVIRPAELATDPVSGTTPGLAAGTIPAAARLFNPSTGYWNDLHTDGNLIVPGNGALIQRGQSSANNLVHAARANADAADRWQLTAGGQVFRGLGATGPAVLDGIGSGTPEGVVAAPIGSTWRRTNGGAGTSFYVKETGTGTTGWVAK